MATANATAQSNQQASDGRGLSEAKHPSLHPYSIPIPHSHTNANFPNPVPYPSILWAVSPTARPSSQRHFVMPSMPIMPLNACQCCLPLTTPMLMPTPTPTLMLMPIPTPLMMLMPVPVPVVVAGQNRACPGRTGPIVDAHPCPGPCM
jgi:hypothetical protein